jgi:hypothetical protein
MDKKQYIMNGQTNGKKQYIIDGETNGQKGNLKQNIMEGQTNGQKAVYYGRTNKWTKG